MQLRLVPSILGITLTLGVQGAYAQSTCARLRDGDGLHLAGRIGTSKVRVYVHTGHPAKGEDGVSGAYLAPSAVDPGNAVIGLEGTLGTDCRLMLTERNGLGAWNVRLGAEDVSGNRTAPGTPDVAVTLRVAPAVDCSGSGTWRTYASRSWPITFTYPVSWRLVESGHSVTLECPDPSRLAMGGGAIRVAHDTGHEEIVSEEGRLGHRMGDFITFTPDLWLVGDESCTRPAADLPSPFCQRARRSTRHGMVVLQGSYGEDRTYSPGGGYAGQGPGVVRYLFIVGRRWVAIDSRDGPRDIDERGENGPVIFDGEDVTSRVVRSVKPR